MNVMFRYLLTLGILSGLVWLADFAAARGADPAAEKNPAPANGAAPASGANEPKQPRQKEPGQKDPGQKKPGQKNPGEKNPIEKNVSEKQPGQKDPKKPAQKPDGKWIEKDREAAALAFAGLHHPELVGLIEQLKETNPAEYQKAIRELARTSERLNQIQPKESKRYELELNAWKIASRVRLLAARLTMSRDPALEQELRDTLSQQIDARLQLLLLEQEEINGRLKKLDSTIETLRSTRDEQAKKSFDNVIRGITKATPRQKPVPSPKKVTQQAAQEKSKTSQLDAGKSEITTINETSKDGVKKLSTENKAAAETIAPAAKPN